MALCTGGPVLSQQPETYGRQDRMLWLLLLQRHCEAEAELLETSHWKTQAAL